MVRMLFLEPTTVVGLAGTKNVWETFFAESYSSG